MPAPRLVARKRKVTSSSSRKSLSPKTKKELAARLGAQKTKVRQLQQQLGQAQGERKIQIMQQLKTEAALLQRMMGGAKEARTGVSGSLKKIEKATAKVRQGQLARELAQAKQERKDAVKLAKSTTASVRAAAQLKAQVSDAKAQAIQKRITLLKKGVDVDQPRKIHPSRVGVPRPRLGLPSVYAAPGKAETGALTRILASKLQRKPGESNVAFKHRLRAYLQRGLARYVNKRTTDKLGVEAALAVAASETLLHDQAAIEAEAAQGGVAIDPVAEAMEPAVLDAMPFIDEITIDMQPELVPDAQLDDLDLSNLVIEAEGEEAALATDDNEDYEVIDLNESDPFYKDPYVLGGAVLVIGGLAYVLLRSR